VIYPFAQRLTQRNPATIVADVHCGNYRIRPRVKSRCVIFRCSSRSRLLSVLPRPVPNDTYRVTLSAVGIIANAGYSIAMRGGRIEQYAAPDELYEAPATLFVAGFVGSPAMNFLPGRLLPGAVPEVEIGSVRLPMNSYRFHTLPVAARDVMVGIRPEHIILARDEPGERTADVEVLFTEPMGADTLGWFQFGEHRLSARLKASAETGKS
jgi:ABC-type sugar transport system ATPase subunit